MQTRLFAFALLAALAAGRPAHADATAQAREHYHLGTKLFDLRRYQEAAREYEAAYEAREDPALLFNIAQAYRLAGDYAAAVASFRSYLRRLPRAANRPEVEARIREMQDVLVQQRKTESSPPDGTLTPTTIKPVEAPAHASEPVAAEPRKPVAAPEAAPSPETSPEPAVEQTSAVDQSANLPGRSKRIAGLAVGIAGLAALGAGIGLAVAAHDASDQVEHADRFDPALDQQGKAFQGASIGLLAGGAAAVATGTILYVLGHRELRAGRVSFAPSAGPQRAGLVANLRF
jgi:tetratricopeptide (TPR) repeat protein